LFACGKEEPSPTVIKGTVSDRKTSAPIEGAVFLLGFVTQSGNNETTEYVDFSTDADGKFEYTQNSTYDYLNGGSNVSKPGYVSNHTFGISKGKENILNITLLPVDAVLKITILNQLGLQKPFYFDMTNPDVAKEGNGLTAHYFLNNRPLILSQGEVYTQYFRLPESKNYLYWDTEYFDMNVKASFKDTVWVYSHDTIEYNIVY
jgi:hypothetical protein